MKMCSTSLITRKIQNKAMMRYNLPPVTMAMIKIREITSADKGVEKREHCALLVGM